jgi:hypothetical protein
MRRGKQISEVQYPFVVRPMTAEEGGGYLLEFPDLPGCVSDSETMEEAIRSLCVSPTLSTDALSTMSFSSQP